MIKNNDTDKKKEKHNGFEETEMLTDASWLARLEEDSQQLEAECQAAMAAVDWEQNAVDISSKIPLKKSFSVISGTFGFNWYRAAAAVLIVFSLGIGMGYLLFRSPVAPVEEMLVRTETGSKVSLARLENSLAKREVKQYFIQSQLVLTDLLEHCDTQSSFSWKNRLDMKRVHALLGKSRYFTDDLNSPDLLSSKELLKKIEWLLYEIMMNDDDGSCLKLQKLQDYVREERLLFKIHLVGKELSMSEV